MWISKFQRDTAATRLFYLMHNTNALAKKNLCVAVGVDATAIFVPPPLGWFSSLRYFCQNEQRKARVKKAIYELTCAHASLQMCTAAKAILEAVEAEVALVVCITEGIPQQDMVGLFFSRCFFYLVFISFLGNA